MAYIHIGIIIYAPRVSTLVLIKLRDRHYAYTVHMYKLVFWGIITIDASMFCLILQKVVVRHSECSSVSWKSEDVYWLWSYSPMTQTLYKWQIILHVIKSAFLDSLLPQHVHRHPWLTNSTLVRKFIQNL